MSATICVITGSAAFMRSMSGVATTATLERSDGRLASTVSTSVPSDAEMVGRMACADANRLENTPPCASMSESACPSSVNFCLAGSTSDTMPENAWLMPSLMPFMAPVMLLVPMAWMTFATPLVTAFCMFEKLVWMPPVALSACSANETMPSAPFWSRSTIASANCCVVMVPSCMAL